MGDIFQKLQLIKYIILQSTISPSLVCDIFVFIHFIRHWRKEIIKSPQNHTLLCLLLVSFIQKTIEIPFLLYYYRWNVILEQSERFCTFWNWFDYTFLSGPLQIFGWFCIERHLFIFHSQLMKNKWCLILLHYLPLLICLIYAPTFYLIVIVFPRQCSNYWDYSSLLCGGPCFFYSDPFLITFDSLFNYGTPILIIVIANLCLFFRIIWQKFQRRQIIEWRRQKWLIIQLIFISILNLSLMSPAVIVACTQALWLPTFASELQFNYFFYLNYFINQFLPFAIVGSLPEMRKDIRQVIERIQRYFDHHRRIQPASINTVIVRKQATVDTAL